MITALLDQSRDSHEIGRASASVAARLGHRSPHARGTIQGSLRLFAPRDRSGKFRSRPAS
jgi:hypothetical protein